MSWSYTGNPASSDKDAVRFLVGDTDTDDQLSTDEEIAWAVSLKVNIYSAAALIAEGISSYFATQVTRIKIGPITEEYGKRAEYYKIKAADLENKASANSALDIYAGGTATADTAGYSPLKVGMHDFGSSS